MKFRETFNTDNDLLKVDRFSNGKMMGVVNEGDRYWETYLNASEANLMEPIIKPDPVEPTPPTLEQLKTNKEMDIQRKTSTLLESGVTITWPYDQQEYVFGVVNQPGEERVEQSISKMGFASLMNKSGIVDLSSQFPMQTQSKNYAAGPTVASPDQLGILQVLILQAQEAITNTGAVLIAQVRNAATEEDLDAIVDNR